MRGWMSQCRARRVEDALTNCSFWIDVNIFRQTLGFHAQTDRELFLYMVDHSWHAFFFIGWIDSAFSSVVVMWPVPVLKNST